MSTLHELPAMYNFEQRVVLEESFLEETDVERVHPLGSLNVFSKFKAIVPILF